MESKLFIGYGNPDRGDDGVAWHLLNMVLAYTGFPQDDLFSSDIIHAAPGLDLWFNFQLLPEMAETIADYDQVIFIDAHTGEINEDISFKPIQPEFQNSPFTHHFTPASCLALAESIKGRYPQSHLLSVRGHQFAFNRELSKETLALVEKAFEILRKDYLEYLSFFI